MIGTIMLDDAVSRNGAIDLESRVKPEQNQGGIAARVRKHDSTCDEHLKEGLDFNDGHIGASSCDCGLVDLLDHPQEGRCMERHPVREDPLWLRPVR